MDLARAPCRAPLTARKMGSGYENDFIVNIGFSKAYYSKDIHVNIFKLCILTNFEVVFL